MAEQARLDEIVSLNADDLDVEELEHRLEMAMAMPNTVPIDDCGCNNGGTCCTYCGINTRQD